MASARALICDAARFASLEPNWTSPHFAGSTSRSSRFILTIQCGSVGALFQRGR
jgi:hypothetical protein